MLTTATLEPTGARKISLATPWIVCFSAALFFFYEFIQMNMFNSISPDLMRDFNINATQLGYLSATYLYADVLFLFPAGLLLDRLSTRTVILTAMTFCIAGTFFFAIATSVLFAAFCHFLAGIGNAFCFLSCIRLASRWFPPRKMALVVGLIVTMAMVGGMVAQTPMALLNAYVGWRNALFLNAALGVAIITIIWRYVTDYPPSYAKHHLTQRQQLQELGFKKSTMMALKNSQSWLCGIYTSLLNLPIMLLCALWGNLYLTQVEGLTTLQASYVISMIFLGTIIGGPVVGWISDSIALRRKPMIIGAILSIATICVIMYVPHLGFWPLIALFFALGFFTSAQVLSYPAIAESSSKVITSSSLGLASVLIMGGGALFQPIFGWIMDLHSSGVVQNGVHIYPLESYRIAMEIFPITFVIGLIASLFVRETHCKAID